MGFRLSTARSTNRIRTPQRFCFLGRLFNSYFWIDRENDLCAVIGTQVLPFYDTHAVAMLKDFESAVYKNLKS